MRWTGQLVAVWLVARRRGFPVSARREWPAVTWLCAAFVTIVAVAVVGPPGIAPVVVLLAGTRRLCAFTLTGTVLSRASLGREGVAVRPFAHRILVTRAARELLPLEALIARFFCVLERLARITMSAPGTPVAPAWFVRALS
jgi:hypothetical protein